MRPLIVLIAAGAAIVAAPALSADPRPPAQQNDGNTWWLDYKTDISEAKRELANDLEGAKKPADRDRAWAEYRREVADARDDYNRVMAKKGFAPGRFASVSVEDIDDRW